MRWTEDGTEARRQGGKVLLLCLLATLPPCLHAQRDPVLKQISVPHPYYYREMYLPQLTSGPSSASWSPDGTELVYAMQGSIWRQKLGSREAVQLTDGPGYDYQPDWSPDGRRVARTGRAARLCGRGAGDRTDAGPGVRHRPRQP